MNQKVIDDIVNEVIDDLPLEEKVKVANLSDDAIAIINKLMANYIQTKLKELSVKQDDGDLTDPEAIFREVWNRLKETHKMRVVK